MSDISIIICAYTVKRWDDLVAAVESIQGQTLPPEEIIVVVDHNQELLKRVQDLNVMTVENTGIRGLSGARNSGIVAAGSDIIAFLDDDAVATADWLMLLNEGFSDPEVLGVGGAVLPLWLSHKPLWLPEEFYWVVGCTYRGMPTMDAMVRNPIGANMSFRRKVFDAVGGFHSEIGRVGTRALGCEETELCIRARQYWPLRGFLYLPQAKVFHRVTHVRTSWRYFCTRCYFEGMSKALVSRYVGAKDSLASECTYTLRILPQGVGRGLIDALFHHDLSGLGRAGAIICGLALTAVSYCLSSVLLRKARPELTMASEDIAHGSHEMPQSLTV